MNEHDPFEALRDTKPFPTDEAITDPEAKAALFEEIIMSKRNPQFERQAQRTANSPSRWRRPTLAAAAAAAVAVAVASATLTNQSAYATVIEATEVVAEAGNGHVRVDVDLRENTTDGTTETGSFYINLSYVGNDSRMTTGGNFDGEGSEDLGDFETEIIQVGENSYLSNPDGTWTQFPRTGLMDNEFIPGLGAAGADPAAMLELLRAAEDMTEASNDDGTTTYVGTITAAAVQQLDPARLPAGVAMIAQEPGNLPPKIGLTVTVGDGTLRSVKLDAVGNYPGSDIISAGFIDATITTTYSDVGLLTAIEPPAPDLIVASTLDETTMANVQIVGAFMDANPDFCNLTAAEGEAGETPEEFTAMLDEMTACFDREAPSDVAAAWRAMNEGMLTD